MQDLFFPISDTHVFHPAIQRAIDLAAKENPLVVERAGTYMEKFLKWTESCPHAWNTSTLSRTDFPVEFSFVSFDNTFRYTVEVADPTSDTNLRLSQVESLINEYTEFRPDELILNRLKEFQKGAKLKYGAWLGGKHDKTSDRFKIYAEVPQIHAGKAEQWLHSLIGKPIMILGEDNEIVMIGYDLETGAIEFYHHISNLNKVGLRIIMRWVGMENRMDDLIAKLKSVYFFSISKHLPGPKSGYSISIPRRGGERVFTYYNFANSLFGSDFHIRQKIHDFANQEGWDLGWYSALSKELTETCNSLTHHGMFGFAFTKKSPILGSFGLTPP